MTIPPAFYIGYRLDQDGLHRAVLGSTEDGVQGLNPSTTLWNLNR